MLDGRLCNLSTVCELHLTLAATAYDGSREFGLLSGLHSRTETRAMSLLLLAVHRLGSRLKSQSDMRKTSWILGNSALYIKRAIARVACSTNVNSPKRFRDNIVRLFLSLRLNQFSRPLVQTIELEHINPLAHKVCYRKNCWQMVLKHSRLAHFLCPCSRPWSSEFRCEI